MLKVNNVMKIYTTKYGDETVALDNFSADFGDTGLVFVLGKSGSGKSTLLNILGGIDAPTDGEIVIDGRSSKSFKGNDFDSYRNTYVGFVFQEYNLIDTYSVGANISLALELQGKKADRAEVEKVMRKVGLYDEYEETYYENRTDELSGGQKQRVAIARALVKNPEILLCDEPTGALDSKTGRELFELLKELSKDKLIVVVSHDRKCAETYGDRIIELADGSVISDRNITDPAAGAATTEPTGFTETPRERPAAMYVGKLPPKRSFVMGVAGLGYKKSRLILSVLLTVIALTCVVFALVISGIDTLTTHFGGMYGRGYELYEIDTDNYLYNHKITQVQLEMAREYNGGKDPIIVHDLGAYDVLNAIDATSQGLSYVPGLPDICMYSLSDLAEINADTTEEYLNLKPYRYLYADSTCRLPATVDEIAITDLTAEYLLEYGYYRDVICNGPRYDAAINSLIGHKLGDFTIVGIYSTELGDHYREYRKQDEMHVPFKKTSDMSYAMRNTVIACSYVYDGAIEAHGFEVWKEKLLLKTSGDMGKDVAFVEKLFDTDGNRYPFVCSLFNGDASFADGFKRFGYIPCLIGAIILSLFALLMTMNFLIINIDHRRNEIGILRALGASRKNVLAVCLWESIIIAGLCFILGCIAVSVTFAVMNSLALTTLFYLHFWHYVVMFAICAASAILSSLIPVARIWRMQPVDIINVE